MRVIGVLMILAAKRDSFSEAVVLVSLRRASNTTHDDFVISRLTLQARYRWEIAPRSNLFLVYTGGSDLPSDEFDSFSHSLPQAFEDRVVDTFALRLHYRFGS